MSDEINRAAEATKKRVRAIDPVVKPLMDLNAKSKLSKVSFENVGRAVGKFAAHFTPIRRKKD